MRVVSRNYHTYPSITGTLMYIVNIIFGLIETVVGLRIILELLGANRGAGFVQFIYSISAPFVAPFVGIFPNKATDGFFLDSAAILAFIVYALIWALISSLLARTDWGSVREE